MTKKGYGKKMASELALYCELLARDILVEIDGEKGL